MVVWFVCLFTEYGGSSKITGLSSLQISYLPTKFLSSYYVRDIVFGEKVLC